MIKFFVKYAFLLFVTSLVSAGWPAASSAFTASLELLTGQRQDQLDWNIAGHLG